MGEHPCLVRIHLAARERGSHCLIQTHRQLWPLGEFGEGAPAKGGEVPADSQRNTEVPGQRPHVGAPTALHQHVQISHSLCPAQRTELEAGHSHWPAGQSHLFT